MIWRAYQVKTPPEKGRHDDVPWWLVGLLGFLTACIPLPVATLPLAAAVWIPYQSGLPTHTTILSLAVSPHNPGILFAGAYDTTGAYVSTDQARSWRTASAGLDRAPVFALRFIGDLLFAGTSGGLVQWHSDHWERVSTVPVGSIYAIEHGLAGGWYLATESHGVFASTDEGKTWTHIAGLDGEPIASVSALDARTIFVGTYGHGVFVTRDGGTTWQSLDGFHSDYVSLIAIDARESKSIYLRTRGGLFHSRDAGVTWQQVLGSIQNELVNALLFDSDSSRLYVATDGHGVFVSGDDDATWQSASLGLPSNIPVYTLAQVDAHTILAGARSGVYVSKDAGQSWQSANDGLGVPQIHALDLDPQTGRLFAATEDGLYRASATGEFARIGDEMLHLPVLSVVLAPSNRQVIYAGTYRHGIFVTRDGGAAWAPVGDIFQNRLVVPGVAVDPRDDQNVFARVLFERIYRSSDGGAVWHAVWTGMPTEAQVTAMTFVPDDPTQMFAGTNIGLFYSRDRGESWTKHGIDQETVFAIWMDPHHSSNFLVGATDGLYRSDDGGNSWALAGLPQMTVTAVLRDTHGAYYVGTKYEGVWTSRDGGNTWTRYGLEGDSITALICDDARGILYAATVRGLFKSPAEP